MVKCCKCLCLAASNAEEEFRLRDPPKEADGVLVLFPLLSISTVGSSSSNKWFPWGRRSRAAEPSVSEVLLPRLSLARIPIGPPDGSPLAHPEAETTSLAPAATCATGGGSGNSQGPLLPKPSPAPPPNPVGASEKGAWLYPPAPPPPMGAMGIRPRETLAGIFPFGVLALRMTRRKIPLGAGVSAQSAAVTTQNQGDAIPCSPPRLGKHATEKRVSS